MSARANERVHAAADSTAMVSPKAAASSNSPPPPHNDRGNALPAGGEALSSPPSAQVVATTPSGSSRAPRPHSGRPPSISLTPVPRSAYPTEVRELGKAAPAEAGSANTNGDDAQANPVPMPGRPPFHPRPTMAPKPVAAGTEPGKPAAGVANPLTINTTATATAGGDDDDDEFVAMPTCNRAAAAGRRDDDVFYDAWEDGEGGEGLPPLREDCCCYQYFYTPHEFTDYQCSSEAEKRKGERRGPINNYYRYCVLALSLLGMVISGFYNTFSVFGLYVNAVYAYRVESFVNLYVIGSACGLGFAALVGVLFDFVGQRLTLALGFLLVFAATLSYGLLLDKRVYTPSSPDPTSTREYFDKEKGIFAALFFLLNAGGYGVDVVLMVCMSTYLTKNRGFMSGMLKNYAGLGSTIFSTFFRGPFKSNMSSFFYCMAVVVFVFAVLIVAVFTPAKWVDIGMFRDLRISRLIDKCTGKAEDDGNGAKGEGGSGRAPRRKSLLPALVRRMENRDEVLAVLTRRIDQYLRLKVPYLKYSLSKRRMRIVSCTLLLMNVFVCVTTVLITWNGITHQPTLNGVAAGALLLTCCSFLALLFPLRWLDADVDYVEEENDYDLDGNVINRELHEGAVRSVEQYEVKVCSRSTSTLDGATLDAAGNVLLAKDNATEAGAGSGSKNHNQGSQAQHEGQGGSLPHTPLLQVVPTSGTATPDQKDDHNNNVDGDDKRNNRDDNEGIVLTAPSSPMQQPSGKPPRVPKPGYTSSGNFTPSSSAATFAPPLSSTTRRHKPGGVDSRPLTRHSSFLAGAAGAVDLEMLTSLENSLVAATNQSMNINELLFSSTTRRIAKRELKENRSDRELRYGSASDADPGSANNRLHAATRHMSPREADKLVDAVQEELTASAFFSPSPSRPASRRTSFSVHAAPNSRAATAAGRRESHSLPTSAMTSAVVSPLLLAPRQSVQLATPLTSGEAAGLPVARTFASPEDAPLSVSARKGVRFALPDAPAAAAGDGLDSLRALTNSTDKVEKENGEDTDDKRAADPHRGLSEEEAVDRLHRLLTGIPEYRRIPLNGESIAEVIKHRDGFFKIFLSPEIYLLLLYSFVLWGGGLVLTNNYFLQLYYSAVAGAAIETKKYYLIFTLMGVATSFGRISISFVADDLLPVLRHKCRVPYGLPFTVLFLVPPSLGLIACILLAVPFTNADLLLIGFVIHAFGFGLCTAVVPYAATMMYSTEHVGVGKVYGILLAATGGGLAVLYRGFFYPLYKRNAFPHNFPVAAARGFCLGGRASCLQTFIIVMCVLQFIALLFAVALHVYYVRRLKKAAEAQIAITRRCAEARAKIYEQLQLAARRRTDQTE